MKSLKIVFFATADFAVPSLNALVESRHDVLAVVTAPDKPAGRGKQLRQSPVKEYAAENNMQVLQPEKLRDGTFLKELKSFGADLFVVVAFRMLPELVWNMPPKGTVNLHASLLPQYRGAAPVNHVILNGEKETGVSVFQLSHTIDTGDVILRERTPIHENENAGSLHDRLMHIGAKTLCRAIDMIADDDYTLTAQGDFYPEKELKEAPKIFKEDCLLDFNLPAKDVLLKIRALAPYPAAFCYVGCPQKGKLQLKIYAASLQEEMDDFSKKVGNIITDNERYIKITTGKGVIVLDELQLQGKKRLYVSDFLRGFRNFSDCRILF